MQVEAIFDNLAFANADRALYTFAHLPIDLECTQGDTNLAICRWFSDARVRVFVLKWGGGTRNVRGRWPRSIVARDRRVCRRFALLRACRLRPCKRVTRSINPLRAARAVLTTLLLRSLFDPSGNGDRVTRVQFGQTTESE